MEKDKDACTEWLQRCCKEAGYYTGYNFRSALLQRSSQDVAKVIRSLDKELSHDKLIEEIMCAFLGIPITAAPIDELSHICQQPGQNLLIYINKYRDPPLVVHQEVTTGRNIQAHPQPVLLFTARPNRQKTLWETMGWQGQPHAVEPTEMLRWGHKSLQAVQSNRTQKRSFWDIRGNQWNYSPPKVQLKWTMLQ